MTPERRRKRSFGVTAPEDEYTADTAPVTSALARTPFRAEQPPLPRGKPADRDRLVRAARRHQ